MKYLILKLPSYTFSFLTLALGYIIFQNIGREDRNIALLSFIGVNILICLWYISVAHYMAKELKQNKELIGVVIVSAIYFILNLISNPFNETQLLPFEIPYKFIALPLPLLNSIFLTMQIKKVLYARSTYFIVMETLIPLIGMFTLTPDIKAWEKSDKT